MEKYQEQIIDLLNASIHDSKPKFNYSNNIDWDKIIEECNAHSIDGLLYPALKNSGDNIDNKIINKLKKITLISAIQQSKHIKDTEEILKLFNENNISVIVLKGLVIRYYYPKPDLRTMCDSDIIIHKEDLPKVRKLLLNEGFREEEDAGHHIAFLKHISHLLYHKIRLFLCQFLHLLVIDFLFQIKDKQNSLFVFCYNVSICSCVSPV